MTGNIAPLAEEWLEAKRDEAAANARRIKIEAQLSEAINIPQEGSKTQKIDGYKITATQPVARNINLVEWEKVKDKVSDELRPVKVKIEADAAGCKYLANNEPEIWAKIATAFYVKPGKVGFKIEEIPTDGN